MPSKIRNGTAWPSSLSRQSNNAHHYALLALGIIAAALFAVRFTRRNYADDDDDDDVAIYEDGDQKSILICKDDAESSILREDYVTSDVG